MKNIFKKIGGLCLGLAMLSGVAVGINSKKPEVEKATGTTNLTSTMTWGGTTDQFSFSDSGSTYLEWSYSKTGTDSPIQTDDFRMYAGVDITVKAKTAYSSGVKIKSLQITGKSSKNTNYLYYKASTGTKVTAAGDGVTTLSWSTTQSTKTADFGAGFSSVTVARATSGNQVRVTSIIVTYSYTATEVVEATGMTLTPSSATIYEGESVSFKAALTGGSGNFEKTIGWTSNATSVIASPSNSEDGDTVTVTAQSVSSQTDVTITGLVVSPGSATNSIVITVKKARTLESIAISGTPSTTSYYAGDILDPTGLVVTGTYDEGEPQVITEGISWNFNPASLSVGDTSCKVTAKVKSISSSEYTVTGLTVSLTPTYDFETNFSTYASSWTSSYGTHSSIKGKEDIGGKYSANIDLDKASNQENSSGAYITKLPVFATKTSAGSWYNIVKFTLQETGKELDSVSVTFSQWNTKTPDIALFKGKTTTGTPLDSATIGTKNTVSSSNFGGSEFAIGYCDKSTSNVQAGIKSITITIRDASSFGTLDHISVASAPEKTVYHVGQTFSTSGLQVKAYDGADESTANSKDIVPTLSITNGHIFVAADTSITSVTATYIENEITKTTAFNISVYGLVTYTKVSSIAEGKFIIVDSGGNDDLVALAGSCNPLDQTGDKNALIVEESSLTITTGEELEVTIASTETSGYYSIQLKNGKYLTSPVSDSGILTSDSPVGLSLSYDKDHFVLQGLNSKYFGFDSSQANRRFRFNKSNAGSNLQLYKYITPAENYADFFLGTLECDPTGTIAPAVEDWDDLGEMFNELESSDKVLFTNGIASEAGTTIQQCLARYDYIIQKYGTTSYSNFMNRSASELKHNYIISLTGTSNSTWIIVAVSLTGLTAIGGYFFYKKRKENI